MKKIELDEEGVATVAGDVGQSDGAFAPKGLQKDPYMAQNNAPKKKKFPSWNGDSKPDEMHRGCACFKLDKSSEYNSFAKGLKRFKLWAQHTKSENIRRFANDNPRKSFYVSHEGSYTKVLRGRDLKTTK